MVRNADLKYNPSNHNLHNDDKVLIKQDVVSKNFNCFDTKFLNSNDNTSKWGNG